MSDWDIGHHQCHSCIVVRMAEAVLFCYEVNGKRVINNMLMDIGKVHATCMYVLCLRMNELEENYCESGRKSTKL